MNLHLQNILNKIQEDKNLSEEKKNAIIKSLQDANKEFEIANFKLDRTEKVKRTTAILLEETIAELEQKRKAVEDQNRELEIEAALEKVRSRSLAMHKSDELNEVILTVFEKLKEFNVLTDGVALINLYAEGTRDVIQWIANPELLTTGSFTLPYFDHPVLSIIWEARESGKDFVTHTFDFEEKNSFWNYTFQHTDYKYLSDELKKILLESEGYGYLVAFEKYSSILVCTYTKKQFSTVAIEILKRFAKVFEQAYIRFLDLQNAEAQAREAQIQLALERVRAKTMAMQKPTEFVDVINVIGEQFVHLGFDIEWVNFGANRLDIAEGIDTWNFAIIPGGEPVSSRLFIPRFDHPLFIDAAAQLENYYRTGNDFFMMTYNKEIKDRWLDHLFSKTIFKDVPDEYRAIQYAKPGYTTSNLALKDTFLSIGKFDTRTFTDEQNTILKRFGNAFGQAYTRFLDLQKAEAQAREAQIEVAIERVRAKALAMHKSEEILQVAITLKQQMESLDLKGVTAATIYLQQDNGFIRVWDITELKEGGEGPQLSADFEFKLNDTEPGLWVRRIWNAKEKYSVIELSGDDFSKCERWLRRFDTKAADNYLQFIKAAQLKHSWHPTVQLEKGKLNIDFILPPPAEMEFILLKMGAAFDLAYRRFLDLQKAEAQAREAQIEAALEKVRSSSLAMHKSDEIKDVVKTVVEKITELNIEMNGGVSLATFLPESKDFLHWLWIPEQLDDVFKAYLPCFNHIIFKDCNEAREQGTELIAKVYSGEDKRTYFNHLFYQTDFIAGPEEVKEWVMQQPCFGFSFAIQKHSGIFLNDYTGKFFSKETNEILIRFSKVFEQSYVRFLDLQKAEAQAREALIEAGLERVRARTMAMHSSDDVGAATATMFAELEKSGIQNLRGGIAIISPDQTQEVWSINNLTDGTVLRAIGVFDMRLHPFWQQIFEAHKRKEDFDYYWLAGKDKENYIAILNAAPGYLAQPINEFPDVHIQSYFFGEGGIWTNSLQAHTEEQKLVMKKFASVFSLTFRRYQDLQKAEAQAREAQIEASLERIRSASMAMHSSDELQNVIRVLTDQLSALGFQFDTANFITNDSMPDWDIWISSPGFDNIPPRLHVPYMDHILFNERNDGLARGEQFITASLNKKEKDRFFRNIYENSIAKFTSEERKKMIFERKGMGITTVLMKIISLSVINYDGRLYTPEENEVIKRMATVFEQSYTRFLDFQKAEANAREATIEASLERVRAKAMSMHSSKDLADTIGIFYQEMKLLSITPRRCGVCLMYKETHTVELSTMNTTEQGDSIDVVGKLRLTGHPVLESIYDNWFLQKEYHPVLRGNEIKEYYKLIRTQMPYPDYPNDVVQYGYFFYFPEGSVYAWTVKELPEDDLQIYRRFTSVLSLTYKRYKDLQAAEANAKEAVKQAALDRIRADIASMRTTKDLDRITPLIWNELTILGVPFIRCGVFIMDNTEQLINTFLSTPDGKAIAAFQLPFTTPGKISFVLENWRNNKNYIDHWDEKTFTEFADSLVRQGALQSVDDYMKTLPADGFCLHFLPFLQGMLYVGNTTQLNEEEINLVQSVAGAFSTAYARYEDFNKLEAAKGQIENTLTNLKQAQTQLVQSEKMASLGELTAGIAHEIQNPLNFVNNFSEVTKELLDEMKAALESGNKEEAEEIANDIAQNLEKINHHGKRADAIVKGMLQHSRKSTGQKEPTDINALCEEYLRLSYHGLRARDKSFNAEFKTDFDESIGKINIIPQDIGRVLLNLFNNAFYAASLPPVQEDSSGERGFKDPLYKHKPTVWVTTSKIPPSPKESSRTGGGGALISVKDNGPGIPQNIVNKIFQPFFTTKPTGQGTGLGLSLSYDIIKAHSGEIKVDTKEGEGSTFIIQLPIIA